jgi:hypothetical protein
MQRAIEEPLDEIKTIKQQPELIRRLLICQAP